ncbi:MAG: peptide chain release factor N(5)-glutamine methyltransferase [Oscillospiraceae bacterium]|nr:peptide chain release factor N(5)-glutamine methyltransferase [Oscillospiraceae bacterium]
MAVTYNDLYMDLRQELRRAGIEAATLEAREIVCFASGKTAEQFLRDGRLYASEKVVQDVETLKQRHLAGEPVAYLIGEWEFYGLPLDISDAVLIPRVDTEVLAGQAMEYINTLEKARVLDLCAGSGCVGLAIASRCKGAHVTLGELSSDALKICRQNIRRTGLSGRVVPISVDALGKPDRSIGEYDCIVSNPPYIPSADIEGLDVSVKDYEPLLALDGGDDGLDFYRSISEKWRSVLAKNGRLYFEVGIGQADDVMRIMRNAGFGDIEIVKDTLGINRVVYGTVREDIE